MAITSIMLRATRHTANVAQLVEGLPAKPRRQQERAVSMAASSQIGGVAAPAMTSVTKQTTEIPVTKP